MQPLCAAGSAPATPKVKGVRARAKGIKRAHPGCRVCPLALRWFWLYASHFARLASHHAGNAGSFGDRVGVQRL